MMTDVMLAHPSAV